MPMTSEQVKAIQDSFAKVAPISAQAAEIFYGRLFEIAPAVKPLFRGDMKEQGKKLMAMLTVVINGLSNLEAVLPAASALAKLTSDTASRQPTMHGWARRCCRRLSAAWASIGRRMSPPPGLLPTPYSRIS